MLVTNQKEMVGAAEVCYSNYPTIVNALEESNVTYQNTKTSYANMDNKFSGSQMGIGWSSNLAQLAMTYYWTELAKDTPNESLIKELYDNFIILSVLAQIIIDGCKRVYEVDGNQETKRISQLSCMSLLKQIEDENGNVKTVKCDFPEFMKYTREIKYIKDGKELSLETISKNKSKLLNRINYDLQCPMNWLEEWLDKIQNVPSTNTIPTKEFFIKMCGNSNRRQMTKIRELVEVYDRYIKYYSISVMTINRLIETAFGLEANNNRSLFYKETQKYTREMLNLLYKMDKKRFLDNFIC